MKCFITLSLLFLTCLLHAQTNVSGGIFTDEQWTSSGSPYIVTDDIAVFAGATLTIDPGVEVKVNAGKTIYIRGEVVLNGTEESNISFKANSMFQSTNFWVGIVLENLSGSDIQMHYVNIESTQYAVNVLQSSGSLLMDHCSIDKTATAIDLQDATNLDAVITNSTFTNMSTFGIYWGDHIIIDNCLFEGGFKAFYGFGSIFDVQISNTTFNDFSGEYTLNMQGLLTNCTISNCDRGVRLRPGLTVSYCEFFDNNTATEISNPNQFDNPLTSCTFCNNNIDIEHSYSFNSDISNNCWCNGDEPEEGIIDAYDNVAYGILTYLPLATDCSFVENVDHLKGMNDILVYPNPVINTLFINTGETIERLNVFDLSGKTLATANGNVQSVDVSFLPSGSYLIQVITLKNSYSMTFVR